MPGCDYVKNDGQQCRARAVSGSALCFFHDPEKTSERDAARRAGGRANQPADSVSQPPVPLKTCADVTGLLAETINLVRRGKLNSKTANAVGYLSNILLKALEQEDFEKELQTLERVVLPSPYRDNPNADDLSMTHLVEADFSCKPS